MYAKTKNEIKKVCQYMADHVAEIDVSEPIDRPFCLANATDSQAPQIDDEEITYGFQVENSDKLAHFVIEHSQSIKKSDINIWQSAQQGIKNLMNFRRKAKLPHKYIPIGVKADALADEIGMCGDVYDFCGIGLTYIGDKLQ